MTSAFVEQIVCPLSGGPLRVVAFETEEISTEDGLLTRTREGALISEQEKVWYPVHNFVPVLLTFQTPFHRRFLESHRDRLTQLDGYDLPDRPCERGEQAVQKTFTEEWDLTQESELSFTRTHRSLVTLNRHVWLEWIQRDCRFGSVLNVGCGIGKETMALREVSPTSNLVGVDLNFALLQAGPRYKHLRDVHFVIASLFHLPFRDASFDLVYCQGVLHHTWSSARAFESISRFVADGGYMFAWVYGVNDHLTFRDTASQSVRQMGKHTVAVLMFHFESIVRPWLSRAPAFVRRWMLRSLSRLMHPVMRRRVIHGEAWNLSNTEHSLRDWLTPRYASRHSVDEVTHWFERLGFEVIAGQNEDAYKQYFAGKALRGVGMTGRRARAARTIA